MCSSFFCPVRGPCALSTLSLHDALPICGHDQHAALERLVRVADARAQKTTAVPAGVLEALAHLDDVLERSEEHTSELQSLRHLVCRLLLEKKKTTQQIYIHHIQQAIIRI